MLKELGFEKRSNILDATTQIYVRSKRRIEFLESNPEVKEKLADNKLLEQLKIKKLIKKVEKIVPITRT